MSMAANQGEDDIAGDRVSECKRCGECCQRFSPTLHVEDLPLLKGGVIPFSRVYTLRKGELAYSPVKEELIILEHEMVKVREDDDTGFCTFYSDEDKSCLVYSHRPHQCRAFECWNPEGFGAALASERLRRRHLIPEESVLGNMVAAHEARCSIGRLDMLFKQLGGEKDRAVLDEILDILQYDHAVRPFFSNKLEIDPSHMDFIFSRPLVDVVKMFGVRVQREPDGGYRMVPIEEDAPAP